VIYAFEDCELDLRRYELRRDGVVRRIEPQVFDVLLLLVRERDRVVTKEEILDTVWGDRFVSESALTSRIKALRQALGDDGKAQRLVRTVRGRGYQFIADVDERGERGGPPTVTPTALVPGEPPPQEIRFCTTDDGVRLAYATMGAGPPLVKVANWLSHLDYDRESVVWRHWLIELSRRHRLVRYDERGCGLSDWEVPEFSFDAWVRDLETIVDTAGIDRFPLLGISQGGAVAVAYAVRHPERVSHLVILGSFARGRSRRAATPEERELEAARSEIVRRGWGGRTPCTARCSRRGSCRRAPRRSGARSTSCSAARRPRRTRGGSSASSPTSTSRTSPHGSPSRPWSPAPETSRTTSSSSRGSSPR
jgi:DNA-binding winged helix-turn-helix (wHTH) protein/pimeloyl-ACP methyl ester carboxylesterase